MSLKCGELIDEMFGFKRTVKKSESCIEEIQNKEHSNKNDTSHLKLELQQNTFKIKITLTVLSYKNSALHILLYIQDLTNGNSTRSCASCRLLAVYYKYSQISENQ